MKIRFKKLRSDAVAPTRATDFAAGWDLTATRVEVDVDDNTLAVTVIVHTGIAVEIPEGHYGDLRSRSSIVHTGCILANGCGVIDSDYRGEIIGKFYLAERSGEHIPEPGERVMQLIITPYANVEFEEATELSTTERGAGGYGSTGR